MKRARRLFEAIYRLYEHSGFAMAGAVAFSFVVSIFPFCIFLGALSGVFGGRELAQDAIGRIERALSLRDIEDMDALVGAVGDAPTAAATSTIETSFPSAAAAARRGPSMVAPAAASAVDR